MCCHLGKLMQTLLILGCFWAEIVVIRADSTGLESTEVVVEEGSDAILNCSFTPEMDLRFQTFDWKKDGKEIFFYDKGIHYNNGRAGQDLEFKGRVSHFENQLEHSNASIRIKNTRVTDSGTYICIFPHLGKRFIVSLVVRPTFRDRSRENGDAVSKVHTEILDATDAGVLLRCEVQGAFPEPEVSWQVDDGNPLPASKPEISFRDGRYDVSVTANATRTATNIFHCVVRQNETMHEGKHEIYVPDKLFQVCKDDTSSNVSGISTRGWIGILIGVLLVGVLIGACGTVVVIETGCPFVPKSRKPDYTAANTTPPNGRNHGTGLQQNGHLKANEDIELQKVSSTGHQLEENA